jgi:hypothetical protein
MSPFDLEKAKKGIPMITRDERKAIFVSLLDGGQPAPLVVEVWDNNDPDDEDDDGDDDEVVADAGKTVVNDKGDLLCKYSYAPEESKQGVIFANQPYAPQPIGRLENYYIDGRHGTVHDSDLDLFMED